MFIKTDSGHRISFEFIEVWEKASDTVLEFQMYETNIFTKTFETAELCSAFINYLDSLYSIDADDGPDDEHDGWLYSPTFNLN